MKKKIDKIKLPPFDPTGTQTPEIPIPPFENTPDVFKDPKGFIFDISKKKDVLDKLEDAYLNAWMSQKLVEITYQRFLHDYYKKDGLNKNALVAELLRTQNEVQIAEGMLQTIKDWKLNLNQ